MQETLEIQPLQDIVVTDETATHWCKQQPFEYQVHLNSNLVKRQKLSSEAIGEVFKYHGQKLSLFNEAIKFLHDAGKAKVITKVDRLKIENFKNRLQDIEFKSQEAWGFNKDINYHIWWLDLPGCSCPRMDNRERMGIEGNIHVETCPWHGWFKAKTEI